MQKSYIWWVIIIVFSVVLILGITKLSRNKSENSQVENTNQAMSLSTPTPTQSPPKTNTPPPVTIDQNKTYTATLKTSEGDIVVTLYADKTPITVNNFVSLAKEGFYDNTMFHRVMKDFMIQGGDPNGDGTGGPGYKFDDEPFEGEYTRGTIAMANSGPNTNGSQFFIMHKDYPLPKNYVIFGKVSEGIDIVDKIAEAPVKANPQTGEVSTPVDPVTVNKVEITEK